MDQDLKAAIGRIEAALVEGGVDLTSASPIEYQPLEESGVGQVTGRDVLCASAHLVWGVGSGNPSVVLLVNDDRGEVNCKVSKLGGEANTWVVELDDQELGALDLIPLFGWGLYASARGFGDRTATEVEAMEIITSMARQFVKLRKVSFR